MLPEMGKIHAALANMTKYFTKLIIYQATLTKKYQIRPPTATTLPPAGRPKSAAYPPRSTSAGSCDGTDTCPKERPHCPPSRANANRVRSRIRHRRRMARRLSSAIKTSAARLMRTRYTYKIFMTPLYHRQRKYGRIQGK